MNSTAYISTRSTVYELYNSTQPLYYLMAGIPQQDIDDEIDGMDDDISDTYVIIFWVAFTIALITVITLIVLLQMSGKKLQTKLSSIEKYMSKVARNALFPFVSKELSTEEMGANSEGVEEIVDAIIRKVKIMSEEEETYLNYNWIDTRPDDHFIWNQFSASVYPHNSFYYEDEKIPWKSLVNKLKHALLPFIGKN